MNLISFIKYRNIYKELNIKKNMENKKRVMVLITIALILSIVAVSLKIINSNEIPTSTDGNNIINDGSGKIGVTIIPTDVEDKLSNDIEGEIKWKEKKR